MEELCTCICYSIIGKEPGLVSKTQNIVAWYCWFGHQHVRN
jgi:hypothetical protein